MAGAMKYYYVYKDHTGKRLQGSLEASSRDEVFETLRAHGIRPIKVIAADGSKANGESRGKVKLTRILGLMAIIAAAAGVLSFIGWPRVVRQMPKRESATAENNLVLKDILDNQSRLANNFWRRYREMGILNSTDFSAASNATWVVEETNRLESVLRLIAMAKAKTRDIFRSVPNLLNAESGESREAQSSYGEWMNELETLEIVDTNRLAAIRLLQNKKGEWKIVGGQVRLKDSLDQQRFQHHLDMLKSTPGTVRWCRDFGSAN